MLKSRKFRTVAAISAAVPAAVLGLSACESTTAPQVGFIAQSVLLSQDKSAVFMYGTYRCSGGPGTNGPVMWVSVKQTDTSYDQSLLSEGSSSKAKAWYDSHTPITCDGKWHGQVFKLDEHKTGFRALETTVNGWLQFCLTDKFGHLATSDEWVNIS